MLQVILMETLFYGNFPKRLETEGREVFSFPFIVSFPHRPRQTEAEEFFVGIKLHLQTVLRQR